MTQIRTVSPVVLFTYNRIDHTKETIHALSKNLLAASTDLIIFSDGPRVDEDAKKVRLLRTFLKTIEGFRSVQIIEQKENRGLATSIIHGVSDVVSSYGSAIVLEDDIVTSPYFLTFMNNALELYKNEAQVWHISGWNYPIETEGLSEAFFWRVMNCWGWATWADRWHHFKKDPDRLVREWDKKSIRRFNLDGAHDFWSQVLSNLKGRIDTWAIFWYATIFEHQGLCLNPSLSYVRNIGLDESGIHCKRCTALEGQPLNMKPCTNFPTCIEEDHEAVERIKGYLKLLKKPIHIRIINRILRLVSPRPSRKR